MFWWLVDHKCIAIKLKERKENISHIDKIQQPDIVWQSNRMKSDNSFYVTSYSLNPKAYVLNKRKSKSNSENNKKYQEIIVFTVTGQSHFLLKVQSLIITEFNDFWCAIFILIFLFISIDTGQSYRNIHMSRLHISINKKQITMSVINIHVCNKIKSTSCHFITSSHHIANTNLMCRSTTAFLYTMNERMKHMF